MNSIRASVCLCFIVVLVKVDSLQSVTHGIVWNAWRNGGPMEGLQAIPLGHNVVSTTKCALDCLRTTSCDRFCYEVTRGGCYLIKTSTSSNTVHLSVPDSIRCFEKATPTTTITTTTTPATITAPSSTTTATTLFATLTTETTTSATIALATSATTSTIPSTHPATAAATTTPATTILSSTMSITTSSPTNPATTAARSTPLATTASIAATTAASPTPTPITAPTTIVIPSTTSATIPLTTTTTPPTTTKTATLSTTTIIHTTTTPSPLSTTTTASPITTTTSITMSTTPTTKATSPAIPTTKTPILPMIPTPSASPSITPPSIPTKITAAATTATTTATTAATTTTIGRPLPEGFTEIGGMYIRLFSDSMSYSSARETCQKFRAHLLYYTNTSLWNSVIQLCSRYGHSTDKNIWVGADDLEVEGQLRWGDGTLLPDLGDPLWKSGEPTSIKSGLFQISQGIFENCVEMDISVGLLNDKECFNQRAFVCQFD